MGTNNKSLWKVGDGSATLPIRTKVRYRQNLRQRTELSLIAKLFKAERTWGIGVTWSHLGFGRRRWKFKSSLPHQSNKCNKSNMGEECVGIASLAVYQRDGVQLPAHPPFSLRD